MDHQGQAAQPHHKRRNCVPKICNAIAALLLLCAIVLGAVGVGLPMWATLSPRGTNDGIQREVAVGMFSIGFTSRYPACVPVSPVCHATSAFRIETGTDDPSEAIDVNFQGCWLQCDEKNRLEVYGMVSTTEYLDRLQARIRNATQDDVIADMTIPVKCRNFIAPRGMIIAGLAMSGFSLILLLIGMKFVAFTGLGGSLCVCAFVVQLIGLILASKNSVRPCDRMNESWDYTFGPSFILVVISTSLLLGVCVLSLCSMVAYAVGRGVQAASNMRGAMAGHQQHGHLGDVEAGIIASSSTDPLRGRGGYGGDHNMVGAHHGPGQYVSIAGVPHTGRGSRGDNIHMQMPSHTSGSVGIPIPISTPSGVNMPNVPFGSAMSGQLAPGTIVTHTSHVEEHTITQQAADA